MTTTTLAPYLTQQFFTNNGTFNAGGFVQTFAGGTNTPIATFTDVTGTVQNTNPIVLNARGEASIWLLPNTSYKFVLLDSAGNTIWTRDNVVNAQLLTLFGGIDTGAANSYILNFASPFSSYVNGEVIYWIPSNSNTGPSTLNVNGLGVIPITNINGTALGANQIITGQTTEVMFFNGAFQLISIGSFSGVTIGTFGQEVPIASATTTDLGTAPAHVVLITGSNTITSFGSSASLSAPIYIIRFAASLTLTFNAVSLFLPGSASIITTPGDSALVEYLGSGNWKVLGYFSVLGAGTGGTAKIKPADTVIISSTTLTPDPDLQTSTLAIGRYSYELMLLFDSVSGAAGFKFQNDGTAVDSRGLSPVVETGFVNGAADGPKQSTFYSAPITYATVGTGANSNQVIYKGSLLVGTVGNFGIEWAQNTSTASATTLRAGSYLNLQLLNTGTSSNIVTHVYQTAGSFVETVPTGFNTLTLEVWGASGGGGGGFSGGANGSGGGGAGSGGYSRSSIVVTGLGGDTVNFTVGTAGAPTGDGSASSATSGTLAITTITANGGIHGTNATSLASAGLGGAGGTSTGGTAANTPGNAGAAGINNAGGGGGGNGGFGVPGINGGGNKGGNGSGTAVPGQVGGNGIIIFSYSP